MKIKTKNVNLDFNLNIIRRKVICEAAATAMLDHLNKLQNLPLKLIKK